MVFNVEYIGIFSEAWTVSQKLDSCSRVDFFFLVKDINDSLLGIFKHSIQNCGKIWRNIQQFSRSPVCLVGYVLLSVSPVTDWVTYKKRGHLGQYYSSLLISTWLPLTWHFSPPLPIQQIVQMVHELILAFEIWVYFLTLLIWGRLLQQGYFPLVHHAQWAGKWGPAWFQLAAFFPPLIELEMLLT